MEGSVLRNGSYFIPRERIYPFGNASAMNDQEGLYLFWETDPAVARRVLPPPLELVEPGHPVVMVYVVNIREPTFTPWYMEGGLGLMCRHGETPGVYFLNLQLSEPGAPMGQLMGREFSGLPKKLCERIVVERTDDWACAFIESKGRRILDVQVQMGAYNDPIMERVQGVQPGGLGLSCFVFQYESDRAPDGHKRFPVMHLVNYDSAKDYRSWEPGCIESISMESSLDDPWAELAVVKPLGAGYSINSDRVLDVSRIARFEGDEADALISYLFSGRWDRSTICAGHQRYGQF